MYHDNKAHHHTIMHHNNDTSDARLPHQQVHHRRTHISYIHHPERHRQRSTPSHGQPEPQTYHNLHPRLPDNHTGPAKPKNQQPPSGSNQPADRAGRRHPDNRGTIHHQPGRNHRHKTDIAARHNHHTKHPIPRKTNPATPRITHHRPPNNPNHSGHNLHHSIEVGNPPNTHRLNTNINP